MQAENFGVLGIKSKERMPNARVRESCGVKKGLVKVFSGNLASLKERRKVKKYTKGGVGGFVP